MSGASGLDYLTPFLPGLEPVLADPDISEIMINGPNNVWRATLKRCVNSIGGDYPSG